MVSGSPLGDVETKEITTGSLFWSSWSPREVLDWIFGDKMLVSQLETQTNHHS